MGGIIMTLGSVCVMCASGFVITTALKWFHTYEMELPKKTKSRESLGGAHGGRIESVKSRIRPEN